MLGYFAVALGIGGTLALLGALAWLWQGQAKQAGKDEADAAAAKKEAESDVKSAEVLVRDQSLSDTVSKLQDGTF